MTEKTAQVERQQSFRVPPVDVYESADSVVMQFELPGVTRDEIRVTLDKDNLRIETTADVAVKADGEVLLREFERANFAREFVLSRNLDTANVQASWSDGVLTLKVPKSAQTKPRKIAITQS